jgi:hypothetical protein
MNMLTDEMFVGRRVSRCVDIVNLHPFSADSFGCQFWSWPIVACDSSNNGIPQVFQGRDAKYGNKPHHGLHYIIRCSTMYRTAASSNIVFSFYEYEENTKQLRLEQKICSLQWDMIKTDTRKGTGVN